MQTEKRGKTPSKDYLASKRVLIIDSSKSFSAMLQRAFIEMGIKPGMVRIASDDRAARDLLEDKPQIIVSEYRVGNVSGFSYASELKKIYPENNDRIFILVTASANENVIVEAADEEADGFLLKPFSADKMMKVLQRVISSKQNPSKYSRAVSAVKQMISQGQYDDAMKLARMALKIAENPATLHSYLATICREQGDLENAIKECEQGLAASPNHYRCLRVKLNIQEGLGDDLGALNTLNVFLNAFPAGPELLKKAFDLSIETGTFDQLQEFYEDYKLREDRPQELTHSVCRALYRAANVSLNEGKIKQAIDFFNWCLTSSGRNIDYIEKIIDTYLKKAQYEEAEKVLKMYPADKVGTNHHAELDFLVSKAVLTREQVIEKGRQLLSKGVVSLDVYKEVITCMKEMGRQVAAENIAYEAMRKLPDDKDDLQKLVA